MGCPISLCTWIGPTSKFRAFNVHGLYLGLMYKVVKVGERLLRTNGGVLEVVMTYACLREHGMGELMVGELAFGILGRALHVMSLGWRE
jgi:hypothetical protein